MKLEFLGAAHEVTGSCHYLEIGDKRLCVDIGMEQGRDLFENQEIPVNAAEIDYILLTHAHIDHTGLLPMLYANGFRGQVFATKATAELSAIMLRDSAHIQQFEAEWRNRKAKRSGGEPYVPLYTMEDALAAVRLLIPCDYDKKIKLCDEITIRFTDVGHLLGSSSIEVFAAENGESRTIVFSGDLGNVNKPILRDPIPTHSADYVVMESTYGDRYHGDTPDYVAELAEIIERTFARGGNVVIPAFAVGRTQELLYFIRQIKEQELITTNPNFEVYVDSPLAVEATSIFGKNVKECFDEEAKALVENGINPLSFKGLKLSITSDDSKEINFNPNPKVIISASGMCEAGRIRHHLKHNLWRPECTILFAGYQAEGSLGCVLLGGAKNIRLFGEEICVKARIARMTGISGHADREGLVRWVSHIAPKPTHVFVVHGEDTVTDSFASLLTTTYGINATAPYTGESWDLLSDQKIREGTREYVKKDYQPREGRMSDVYRKLFDAAQQLLAIVKKYREGANKDIRRFTEDIEKLCRRWDK